MSKYLPQTSLRKFISVNQRNLWGTKRHIISNTALAFIVGTHPFNCRFCTSFAYNDLPNFGKLEKAGGL